MLISLLKVCQEKGSRREVLEGIMEVRVILDVMDDVSLPSGRYPLSFVLISLLEVCQVLGVKKGVTWRMLRVPDRRLGLHGHP